jgi:hypothetical protein
VPFYEIIAMIFYIYSIFFSAYFPEWSGTELIQFYYNGPLFLACAFRAELMIRSINSDWVIPEAAAWWKRTVEGVIPGRVFGSRTATFPSFLTNISILE